MTLLLRILIREIPKVEGAASTILHKAAIIESLTAQLKQPVMTLHLSLFLQKKIESPTHFRIGCYLEDPINVWTYFSTVEDFLYSKLLATLHIKIKLLLYMTTSGRVRVSLHNCHVPISPNRP